MSEQVRLGLRENAAQFSLLVGLNALVGGMVGLERSVLPLIGQRDFGLHSKTAILAFVLAFGIAKALTNLAAGGLAERVGRRRLLVIGWMVAAPIPILIGLAPSWSFIVAANILLGINQGLAWSMTVVMKIDLAGPARRGLALGLNEAAGYLGVAATAFLTGVLAASYAPRTVVWVGATAIAAAGIVISVLFVRDTAAYVALEQRAHGSDRESHTLRSAFVHATARDPVLRSCSQAGLVNNLNDALAWGLAPLFLAAHGASVDDIAVVAAIYPVVWGAGQLLTGWISDYTGRKPLIASGMLVQAAALALLVAGNGSFPPSVTAAAMLGVGTAMVYPTLIAAVSDAVAPRERARAVGVYRFWRDAGFVAGGVLAGVVADAIGSGAAIALVAGITGASGLWVLVTRWTTAIGAADAPYRQLGLAVPASGPYAPRKGEVNH
jgi:MFS family permease